MLKPRRKRLALSAEAKPLVPATEICLFTIGVNHTEKGDFLVTKDDAKGIVDQYIARATDVCWDYAHSETLPNTTGMPRIAGAWSKLELRDDGVWATEIRWLARCLVLIEAEELKYWSPFFDIEQHDDGVHAVNLINVGITNIPATHGIQAIAASMAPNVTDADGKTTRPTATATGRLTAILSSKKESKPMATKAEMIESMKGLSAKCAEMSDLISKHVPDDAKDDDAPPSSDGPDSDDGPPSSEDESDELKAARAVMAAHEAKKAAALAAKDGPPTSRSEGVKAAQAALNAAKAKAGQRTGEHTPDPELAAAHAANVILSARVAKIEASAKTEEFANLIASGKREGKIPPAMVEQLSTILDGDPKKLRAYLAAAPKIVSSDSKTPKDVPASDGEELTAEETTMCLSHGVDPVAAKKHVLAARRIALSGKATV